MRRGSKITNKKVSVPEETEDEKVKKTETKKAMIRAEFEKHKKELKLNVSDISKMNEIRLKNQLEELMTANAKKRDDLHRAVNFNQNLERQNLEASHFEETSSKINMSKQSETCLSVGYQPMRTTTSMFGAKENNLAEVLSDKNGQLLETLSNIKLLLEQEEEMSGTVQEKYEELKKNQLLLRKKVNELEKMNDHAGKRFTDLQRVEFLAKTKHATAESDLKGMKDELREMKNQENTYKKQKEDDKKKELEYLNNKQNEMSKVLIELDKKRLEYQKTVEEIKRLEMQFEEMRNKRKTTRVVTKYIETLNALEADKKGNVVAVHQALKELELLDTSREISPGKRATSPVNKRDSPYTFAESPHRVHGMDEDSEGKRNSVITRNYYIEKIQRFYEDHPEGPEMYAEDLIQDYLNQCYQEESLKTHYEELQSQKKKRENELSVLEKELGMLKGKNEYITRGVTGSKILDSNEQEAIDSGMLVVNTFHTTLNQAKFEFENTKEADNHAHLFSDTEAFVLRCYLDSLEMISRLSKVLFSIYTRTGGNISENLWEVARNIRTQMLIFKKGKKLKQGEASTSQTMSDAQAELRAHTDNASNSDKEREPEQPDTLDVQEIYEMFLTMFIGETAKASEFISHIRTDVMICSFLSMEDIKNYLQKWQLEDLTESQMKRTLRKTDDLRNIAIEHLLQKFGVMYKLYTELVGALEQGVSGVYASLKLRGAKIDMIDLDRKSSEPNSLMKKALQKKWQTMMERYDYDPTRDFRKETTDTESSVQQLMSSRKEYKDEADNAQKEIWDNDDLKAKLNEIAGLGSKNLKGTTYFNSAKTLFKGKNDEEQKRLQAKKNKEKQKQAIENMSDDAFLEWQRKQLKKGVKEEIKREENEGQLLRRAQADLSSRLSQTVPLNELKRMIENAKVLSKIQILEKHNGTGEDSKTKKFHLVDNYIPPDPIKVPKSPPKSASQHYRIKIKRNAFTPTNKVGGSLFQPSSERVTETEADLSHKDSFSRTGFPTKASKFRTQAHSEAPFNFASLQTQEDERPWTEKGKRISTDGNMKKWPTMPEENRSKSRGRLIKPFPDNKPQTPSGPLETKKRKKPLLIQTAQRVNTENGSSRLVKSKSGRIGLPKLEGLERKSRDIGKKKRTKSTDRLMADQQDNINMLLNIQTDPSLRMVYTPNFFATSYSGTAFTDELDYKFDMFKFKAPGGLISEKL